MSVGPCGLEGDCWYVRFGEGEREVFDSRCASHRSIGRCPGAVMSNSHAAQLERAKRVVNSVMKTRGARFLFNKPVDPVELDVPDYFDVISDPIDLGTIHRRLLDGQRHEWDVKSHYETPLAVFEDVSRVWKNCYTYNKGPNDAPIREICRKTQLHFETKWREAGLPTVSARMQSSNETDVPEMYSVRKSEKKEWEGCV